MKQKIKRITDKLMKLFGKPELSILPGNIAFNIVLAFFPFLILIILIVSSFSIDINSVINLVRDILPSSASDIVIEVISGKCFDSNVFFFVLIGLAVATNGTYAIITASNSVYGVKNSDMIKDRVKAVILLFIILILFLFLIIVPIFGDSIIRLLGHISFMSGITDEIMVIFKILQWPITYMIVYFNIKLIYAIAPSIFIESETTSKGAIFTTVIWIVSTFIFKYYLTYFAKYDIIYGNLSSIIILMIWLYLLSTVFVMGIAINEEEYKKKKLK